MCLKIYISVSYFKTHTYTSFCNRCLAPAICPYPDNNWCLAEEPAVWNKMLKLTICVIALLSQHVVDSEDHPKGHLQPLGRHQPPVGNIEERDSFPTPLEMFEKYVRGSKPVIFRGILEKGMLPAYKLWTDSYLR